MTNTVIRMGTAADVEPAIAVWQAAGMARRGGRPRTPEAIRGAHDSFRKPDLFLLVAERDGHLVGMATATHGCEDRGAGPPIPGLCYIGLVYVAPEVWGQGIGGQLVDAVLAEARQRGYERAQLSTQTDNERAMRLYARYGFTRSGPTGTGADGETIVHLGRDLADIPRRP